MPNTDEIFDYVMNSPENTNPAVLRGMLNSIEGGGGGGGLPPYENADINKVLTLADSGETGTETLVAIEEQTVTTVSRFGTAKLTIDYTYWTPGVTVHLTVDGNNYDCIIDDTFYIQAIVDGVTVKVWEESGGAANFLGKPSTTYTVSATIEAPVPIPAPAWVTSGGGGGVLVVHGTASQSAGTTTLDKTWAEIESADFAVISIVVPKNGQRIFAYITSVVQEDAVYRVQAFASINGQTDFFPFDFKTDSPNGYPVARTD